MVENRFEGVLAEDEEVVRPLQPPLLRGGNKSLGTHLQLVGTLLTADIQHPFLWQVQHGLEGEGRLADTGFTT